MWSRSLETSLSDVTDRYPESYNAPYENTLILTAKEAENGTLLHSRWELAMKDDSQPVITVFVPKDPRGGKACNLKTDEVPLASRPQVDKFLACEVKAEVEGLAAGAIDDNCRR